MLSNSLTLHANTNMEQIRDIIFYKDYFQQFYVEQTIEVRRKINYVFNIIQTQQRVPVKFFRIIEDEKGLYEIRVEFESNIYRIFCCFDDGNLVVLFNAFQKKTQKTPAKEIEKARKLKEEYLKEKKER